MKLLGLACFFTLVIVGAGLDSANWTELDGKCYTVRRERGSYQNSIDACKAISSILVEPKTQNQLEFVRSHVISDQTSPYWIGLRLDNVTGSYTWRSGEVTHYSNFMPGSVPNMAAPCVMLASPYSLGLTFNKTYVRAEVSCDLSIGFICEKAAVYNDFNYTYTRINVTGRHYCPKNPITGLNWGQCMFACDLHIECVGFKLTSGTCVMYKFQHDCSNPVDTIHMRRLSRCDRATRMDRSWPITYEYCHV